MCPTKLSRGRTPPTHTHTHTHTNWLRNLYFFGYYTDDADSWTAKVLLVSGQSWSFFFCCICSLLAIHVPWSWSESYVSYVHLNLNRLKFKRRNTLNFFFPSKHREPGAEQKFKDISNSYEVSHGSWLCFCFKLPELVARTIFLLMLSFSGIIRWW